MSLSEGRRSPSRSGRARRGPVSRSPRPAAAAPQPSALEQALDAAQRAPQPEPASFAELGLPAPLVAALAARGVTAPFAIQSRALPDALAGADVLGRAQTGSGKTLAFGLPLLARLAADGRRAASRRPRGLVLVPTRELAQQVAGVLAPLAGPLGLRLATVFGGAPYGRQIDALERGVDAVVATPGRLIDLVERGVCDLGSIDITVLDEADHMADLGFLPAVRRLLDDTPAGGQRMLFSATLDRGVDRLVAGYLESPKCHAVAPAAAAVDAMDHKVFSVEATEKVDVIAEIAARPGRTLVFARTKHGADRLARQLGRLGVEAAALHGDLKQNARQRALAGFAAGHPRVLVATDVAARGIHVDDVDLVVHFDPPSDAKDYLHRSGRTARAGARGTVLALATPDQVRAIRTLHRDAGIAADDVTAVTVRPRHEAVRALAATGTPVPPAPPQREPAQAGPARGRRRGQPGGQPGRQPRASAGRRSSSGGRRKPPQAA